MRTFLGGRSSGHTATHRFPGINVHGGTHPFSTRVLCADPALAEGANAYSRGPDRGQADRPRHRSREWYAPTRSPNARPGPRHAWRVVA
jgi:hypothetical protein